MELKPEIQILKANKSNEIPYDLLLLSDDTKEAINKNLNKGELYIAKKNDEIIASFILKIIEKETIEIKNIAVTEKLQGKGYGTKLLNFIIDSSENRGFKKLIVGTCDQCNKEISFYKKAGFVIKDKRKNFFIDNYKDPIFENGLQIKDMILLSMELNSKDA
ncbi:MAG: GNAT family N-acetyltransferase [Bacteroidetes bacterium]|nr:GNAT family N-acetyltransferase [Bacteroidota bacterium]